jgi:hypothetical protein
MNRELLTAVAQGDLAALRAAVEELSRLRDDDEYAHKMEDAIHQTCLAAIANNATKSPAEMARIALQTRLISFRRWYA